MPAERDAGQPRERSDTEAAIPAESDADSVAETFVELDDDLERPTPGGTDGRRRALVVDADRVDAADVPDTYPLAVETEQAIELTVDFGMETATAYLAWPTDDRETGLTRLLDALDVELRDLYGETVLVERQGIHAVIVTPAETPTGRDHRLGLLGGMGFVVAFIGILAIVPEMATVVAPLWALVTYVALPYLVYKDAWYVRTHSDWDGGPPYWTLLAALPFLNLGTIGLYLWRRSRARFFSEQHSLVDSIATKIRSLL